jgi:hypothetical protein
VTNPLQDLVDDLRNQAQLDSQGQFSLDLLARQQKLILQQRKEPWLFVFKFIQAAVGSGAAVIELHKNGQSTTIGFTPKEPAGEPFIQPLLRGEPLHTPWLRHLALGVILAFASEGRSHRFRFHDGLEGCCLSKTGGSITVEPAPAELPTIQLEVMAFPSQWWKPFSGSAQLRKFTTELQYRTAFAPIPIRLNGQSQPARPPECIPRLAPRRPGVSWTEGSHRALSWMCQHLRLQSPGLDHLCWPKPHLRTSVENRVEGQPASSVKTPSPVVVTTCWSADLPLEVKVFQDCAKTGANRRQKWSTLIAQNRALHLATWSHPTLDDNVRWEYHALIGASPCRCRREAQSTEAEVGSGISLQQVALQAILPQGPALLIPIWEGICLDPIEIQDGPPGALALCCRPDWIVDLSQLQLVQQADSTQQAVQWARQIWADQVQEIRGWITSYATCERLGVPVAAREAWRALLKANRPAK